MNSMCMHFWVNKVMIKKTIIWFNQAEWGSDGFLGWLELPASWRDLALGPSRNIGGPVRDALHRFQLWTYGILWILFWGWVIVWTRDRGGIDSSRSEIEIAHNAKEKFKNLCCSTALRCWQDSWTILSHCHNRRNPQYSWYLLIHSVNICGLQALSLKPPCFWINCLGFPCYPPVSWLGMGRSSILMSCPAINLHL